VASPAQFINALKTLITGMWTCGVGGGGFFFRPMLAATEDLKHEKNVL
jgi:hypothetical protein